MQENFHELSLGQLYDLLMERTEKLLAAIQQKGDGYAIRDLNAEVEEINLLIKSRKAKEEN